MEGERVVPERTSAVAVAGIFILVSLILFILIVMVVYYFASPEYVIYDCDVAEQPKFLTRDRFSCFVASPLETAERKAHLLKRGLREINPMLPSPLVAQILAPLGKLSRVKKDQDETNSLLFIETFGMTPLVALSRDKRTCKEILVSKWILEHKSFFPKRRVKISGVYLKTNVKEEKDEAKDVKDKEQNLVIWAHIVQTAAHAEQNTCSFLLHYLSSVPELPLDLESPENFNLEEIEILLY